MNLRNLLCSGIGRAFAAGALAGALGLGASGCSHSSDGTVEALGWAFPLPTAEEQSPRWREQAARAADRARLRERAPWVDRTLSGVGSSNRPEGVTELSTQKFLMRVQAREAARRSLADQLAMLPMPSGTGSEEGGGAGGPGAVKPAGRSGSSGRRVGDAGVLTPSQTTTLSDWVTTAPVLSERLSSDGRMEVRIALPLENVARLLLDEPLRESGAVAPGAAPGTTTATVPREKRGQRRSLAPLPEQELLQKPGATGGSSAETGGRDETLRRATAHARRFLWERVKDRKLFEEEEEKNNMTLMEAARTSAESARLVDTAFSTAPVESVSWTDDGRCIVKVSLDWESLRAALVTNPDEKDGDGKPTTGSGGALPLTP